MDFHSMEEFGQFLEKRSSHITSELKASLQVIGKAVKQEAISSIGSYQSGIAPYPAWKPLAQATLDRKHRMGEGMGHPNTPLYARGNFKKDIGYRVEGSRMAVHIGSNVDYVVHNEYGTHKIPPRPVFGPAALRAVPKVLDAVESAVVYGLAGVRISSRNSSRGNYSYASMYGSS